MVINGLLDPCNHKDQQTQHFVLQDLLMGTDKSSDFPMPILGLNIDLFPIKNLPKRVNNTPTSLALQFGEKFMEIVQKNSKVTDGNIHTLMHIFMSIIKVNAITPILINLWF